MVIKHKRTLAMLMAAAVLMVVGVSVAFFTSQVNSQGLLVSTGSISIDSGQFSVNEIQNLMPGEERTVDWVVSNTGSAPVYLKGRVDQVWDNPELNGGIHVTKIEVEQSGVWLTLAESSLGLQSEFFYGLDGQEANLYMLGSGDTLPMRMTVKLDENVGDEFQVETSQLSIHLAAKQSAPGAGWPSEY